MTMEDKKLTMEEMEQVAGGRGWETADDSRFLNVLLRGRPGQCDRYGNRTYASHTDEIARAWASVGIRAEFREGSGGRFTFTSPEGDNRYYLDGKQISRDAAWAHAEQVVGKHLQKSDWKW